MTDKGNSLFRRFANYFSLLFLLFSLIFSNAIRAQVIRFRDVTDEKEAWGNRVNGVSCYGHGVAFADISGDSLPDIYISNAVRNANKLPEVLYISQKNGPYIENDYARGVDDNYGATGSHGIIFVDYDNDGDFDIFNATTDDRIRLYRNRGNGYFDDYSDQAHIPARGLGTRGIVAFDANNDGYMDLLGVNWGPVEDENNVPQITPPQPNEFYLNNGNGTFTRDDSRGLTPVNPSHIGTQGVTAIDVDNDGDMDVFVCHRNYAYLGQDEDGNDLFGPDWDNPAPNELFINDGTGHFDEEAKARGIYNRWNDCNGTTFADYDNDGDLDAFVVPKQKYQKVNVYRNRGDGTFEEITDEMNIRQWGFSILFLDVDNDGDLDAYTMNTRRKSNALYLNDGQGHLTEIDGTGLELYCYDPRGGAVADIDDDGDLDIYFVDANKDVNSNYGNYLLRNDTQTTNRWLKVYGRGPKGDMGGFGTKIWVFDQGHMEEMNHLVGYRQVINAYGYLCQDEPIQHFGLGQRDTVDVKIQMLDGTTLKAFNVPAKRKIFFSKPDELVKFGGDEQQGFQGQQLSAPLQVQVKDAYGNPVIGVPVTFQVLDDNGHFIEDQPVYTNTSGIASVRYVVGNQNLAQHIRATSSLISDQQVDFTVYATDIEPSTLSLISASQVQGTVGAIVADSVKVRVVNSDNEAVAGQTVKFEIVAGNGSLLPGDSLIIHKKTNSQGYAAVAWRLGTVAGEEQKLKISAELFSRPLNGSPLYVTGTAHADVPNELAKIKGDAQQDVVNHVLPDSLIVRVLDQYQNPIPDIDVRFSVESGQGKVAGSDAVTIATNSYGQAKVLWQLGQSAGQQRVRAVVVSNTDLYADFTAQALHDEAYELKYSGQQEYYGIVDQPLADSIAVQVVDQFGNAVDSFSVDFQVISGGGSVNEKSSISVLTDANGFSRCQWKLGTVAGERNNSLRISATGLEGSPVEIFASAKHADAAELMMDQAPDSIGIVGKPLSDSIRVRVTDAFGNAVDSFSVNFSIQGGDGTVNGETDVNVLTDHLGRATCQWILGPVAGFKNNVLQIQADGLAGSPVEIKVSAQADHAFRLKKVSGDYQTALPDSTLHDPLIVAVSDTFGNPVANHQVVFTITQGDASFDSQPQKNVTTDSIGRAQAYVTVGERAGAITIQVTSYYNGNPLIDSPINFTAYIGTGEFDPGHSTMSITSPIIANGRDRSILQFHARDAYGNPVSGVNVTFFANGEKNTLIQPVDPTDSTGTATGFLMSTKAQAKKIWVEADEIPVGQDSNWVVRFIPTEAKNLLKISGDNQSGIVGSVLDSMIVVALSDSFQNPIASAEISVQMENPEGQMAPKPPIVTDSLGYASTYWTLGTVPGDYHLILSYHQVQPVTFSAHVQTGPPALLKKISGDNQYAKPGELLTLPLVVQATDSFSNPIADVSVLFKVESGGGTVTPAEPIATDSLGKAVAQWQIGLTDSQVVKAQIVGTDSIHAIFHAYFTTNHNPVIRTISDTTIYEMQELVFQVFVFDQDGDQARVEAMQLPDGASFDPGQLVFSWKPNYDQAGEYIVTFVATDNRNGTSQKTVRISVLNSNRAPRIISFQPQDTIFSVTYYDTVYFKVVADDPDGDSLRYAWYFDGIKLSDADSLKLIINSTFPKYDSCRVCVSDGDKSVQKNWYFDVKNTATIVEDERAPGHFSLGQNYPNPFNPETTIEITLPRYDYVRVLIYNTSGQLVRVLAKNYFSAGTHRLVWDARDEKGQVVPSGIYYYEMQAGSFTDTKKLLLLK